MNPATQDQTVLINTWSGNNSNTRELAFKPSKLVALLTQLVSE